MKFALSSLLYVKIPPEVTSVGYNLIIRKVNLQKKSDFF